MSLVSTVFVNRPSLGRPGLPGICYVDLHPAQGDPTISASQVLGLLWSAVQFFFFLKQKIHKWVQNGDLPLAARPQSYILALVFWQGSMLLATWHPFPSSCLGRLTLVVASPKLPYGQMSLGVAGRKRMHQEILPFHLGLQKPHSKHLPCTSCVLCLLLCVLLMTHTLSKKTVRVFPSNSAGGFCLQPGLSEIQW